MIKKYCMDCISETILKNIYKRISLIRTHRDYEIRPNEKYIKTLKRFKQSDLFSVI